MSNYSKQALLESIRKQQEDLNTYRYELVGLYQITMNLAVLMEELIQRLPEDLGHVR